MSRRSCMNVALGLWLVVSAFALPHKSGTGVIEDVVTGSFVALVALWAARRSSRLSVSSPAAS
jgi:hypothetical protein